MTSRPKLRTLRLLQLSYRRARTRSSRGAALVETAIVLPLVLTLAFGILEYGLLLSQSLALSSSARAGARVGAQEGIKATGDYDILQAVRNSRGTVKLDSIQRVVIYKADSANGKVPTLCKQGTAVAGLCNVYTPAALDMTPSQLASSGSTKSWPANTRQAGTDYLGVWIDSQHKWLTNLFNQGPSQVRDAAVMRIEPDVETAWVPLADAGGTTTSSTPTTKPPVATTTTTTKPTTTTTKKPSPPPVTTTTKPGSAPPTTAKPTTTTAKPTTTTKKPTTTTSKPATTTTKPPTVTTWKRPPGGGTKVGL